MADNYLEKRMEDYARGRLAGSKARPGRRSGVASVKYPAQGVAVGGAGDGRSRAVIRMLVESGNRVAFTCPDSKTGTAMAQECGGRFYPTGADAMAADLSARGEGVDTVICFTGTDKENCPAFSGARQYVFITDGEVECDGIVLVGGTPEAVAMMVFAIVHPHVTLLPQTICL